MHACVHTIDLNLKIHDSFPKKNISEDIERKRRRKRWMRRMRMAYLSGSPWRMMMMRKRRRRIMMMTRRRRRKRKR